MDSIFSQKIKVMSRILEYENHFFTINIPKDFSFRITFMVKISYFFRIMAFKALLLPFLESVIGNEVGITETKRKIW